MEQKMEQPEWALELRSIQPANRWMAKETLQSDWELGHETKAKGMPQWV
jgi:hypothetical protein